MGQRCLHWCPVTLQAGAFHPAFPWPRGGLRQRLRHPVVVTLLLTQLLQTAPGLCHCDAGQNDTSGSCKAHAWGRAHFLWLQHSTWSWVPQWPHRMVASVVASQNHSPTWGCNKGLRTGAKFWNTNADAQFSLTEMHTRRLRAITLKKKCTYFSWKVGLQRERETEGSSNCWFAR